MRTANAFVERITLNPGDDQRERLWADHISAVFDVEAFGRDSIHEDMNMTTMLCNDLIFVDFRSPVSKVVRSARKASRLGTDHFHVQFYRSGHSVVRSGKKAAEVRPGQMVVFDLSQSVDVEAESVDALGLIVPRSRFSSMFGEPGDLHARTFDIDGSVTRRLLHSHLARIAKEVERIVPTELESISSSILALCASCIPRSDRSPYRKQLSPKADVCRYVALKFGSMDLSVSSISEKFGLSRSTLQRMFEAEGGFARYVREIRLQKSLGMLARSGSRAPRSLTTVAFDCGFSDSSSFTRSFTRHFGISPKIFVERSMSDTESKDNNSHLSRWMSYILI